VSPADRKLTFRRLRELPLVGRVADWGMGPAAASTATERAGARIAGLKATESVCPYCAVGCGQVVYTRDGELVDIEGNPNSPINQGTLCRRPGGTEWEDLDLETAMDMIADRLLEARRNGWQDTDHRGWKVNRTMGFAHFGGATLDNEENYLIKKSFTALGAVQIENQARI
jgi:formate dehydrogenase major subunit